MKLISFLAIPLLSIAVSAQPPHNPDTQNTNPFPDDDIQEMDQSQNDAAQDIPYFLDSDFEMLESILGSVAHTMNQPQGVSAHDGVQSTSAATWNAQSPLGSTSQDMHQYPGSSSQSAQQPQGISAQDREQSTSAATWIAPNPLAATSQNMHQYPGSSSQSAQQPQEGISAKNRKKSMRAASQSDQRSDRRRFQTERDRLVKAVRVQGNILIVMNSHINSEKTHIIGVNGMIEAVGIKLQDISLSSGKRLELQEKSRELRILANELDFRQSEKHQSRIETMIKRRNANVALQVFQKNRDLIAKHNFDNEAKVESSPGSLYNIGILKKQYDEALEDLEKLRAEQKRISDAISVPDDVASKAQREKLENMIQDLKSYSRIAGGILWAYKNTQPIGAWIPTSLDSYVQDFQI
ncbi:hypothetical protein BASA83_008715 [Batrachochytrium salamandrivorans]|nr:hypothetical protein BASA81_011624 [Batrachochytrium salamandrivorans]KAH9269223.1 hypothetical protein BASA83_008715 [Batrachochytrium salamandrivorans]